MVVVVAGAAVVVAVVAAVAAVIDGGTNTPKDPCPYGFLGVSPAMGNCISIDHGGVSPHGKSDAPENGLGSIPQQNDRPVLICMNKPFRAFMLFYLSISLFSVTSFS